MYLAIMLIIITLLVFYNEINTKMNIAEYILLAISLIAIIRAAVNYINIDTINEGFTSQTTKYNQNTINNNKANNKNNNKNKNNNNKANNNYDENIIMESNDSDEYLDSDEIPNPINMNKNSFNSIDNAKVENKKSNSAINEINALLGINNVSQFTNIPIPTSTEYTENEIKSVFNPQVIIGKGNKSNNDSNNSNDNDKYNSVGKTGFGSTGNSSKWNSAFANDGFKFNNTMAPDVNLWRDEHGYYNGGYNSGQNNDRQNNDCQNNSTTSKSNSTYKGISGDQWSQSMDDYNKGKWQRNMYNRPSDYVDYTSPSGYGTTTPDSFDDVPNPSKKCGEYDDLSEDQSGNLVVKDYTQAKKWVAGYTYVPPVNWDVPQRHAPVCKSVTPNVQKLTGIMDRGLPINALELNADGKIADTEDTVKLSNIGSMIPKFNYQEEPFSKPYA